MTTFSYSGDSGSLTAEPGCTICTAVMNVISNMGALLKKC